MLPIDLTGKRAFVAGIADDKGYGWAIVRALAQAGASICVGTWPPTLRIFQKSLERGKLDVSLPGGGEIEFERIYPGRDAPVTVPMVATALLRHGVSRSAVAAAIGGGLLAALAVGLIRGPTAAVPFIVMA